MTYNRRHVGGGGEERPAERRIRQNWRWFTWRKHGNHRGGNGTGIKPREQETGTARGSQQFQIPLNPRRFHPRNGVSREFTVDERDFPFPSARLQTDFHLRRVSFNRRLFLARRST